MPDLPPVPANKRCRCGSRIVRSFNHREQRAGIWECIAGKCGRKYQGAPPAQPQAAHAASDRPGPSKRWSSNRSQQKDETYTPRAKQKTVSVKKISQKRTQEDWIQAVLRHPAFQEEAKALRDRISQMTGTLSREEQAGYLAQMLTENEVSRKWEVEASFVINQPPKLAVKKKGEETEKGEVLQIAAPAGADFFPLDYEKNLVRGCDGRRLTVELDLALPTKALLKGLLIVVERYKLRCLLADTMRVRPTEFDPWLIYDLRHHNKLTIREITKRLCNLTHLPLDSGPSRRKEAQVQRAYQRAVAMIKEVGKRVNT